MKKFIQEFKEFAARGNVIDLAVAVIIGNAINTIVKSLVSDIFTPIISLFIGRIDLTSLAVTISSRFTGGKSISIKYGTFLESVLNFLTITFCIFIILKALDKIRNLPSLPFLSKNDSEDDEAEEKKADPPKAEDLLMEIRDLLKEQQKGKENLDLPDHFDDKH